MYGVLSDVHGSDDELYVVLHVESVGESVCGDMSRELCAGVGGMCGVCGALYDVYRDSGYLYELCDQ